MVSLYSDIMVKNYYLHPWVTSNILVQNYYLHTCVNVILEQEYIGPKLLLTPLGK